MKNQSEKSESEKGTFNLEIPVDLAWELNLELSFLKMSPNDLVLEAIRKYLKQIRILRIINAFGYELEISKKDKGDIKNDSNPDATSDQSSKTDVEKKS